MPNSFQVPFFSNFFYNKCLQLLTIWSVDEERNYFHGYVLGGHLEFNTTLKGPASAWKKSAKKNTWILSKQFSHLKLIEADTHDKK